MNWKRILIAAMTRGKYKAFLADTKNPELAHERLWTKEIVPLLRQSFYWHPLLKNKSSINLEDFSITDYEDYEEGLLAAQHSHIQPFNSEEIIFWSETSGTAGVRKFFPITASFQKQFQRTMPPFLYSLTQRFAGFFKEKIVYLVAVDSHNTTPAGTPCGWISNFNYRHLPSFVKRFYAIPSEVFASTELYNQWAPVYALASDLSAAFAVTPMVIDAFLQSCIHGFKEYLPYVLGEKSLPGEIPALHVTRRRQRYLQGLMKKNKATVKELWPSLQFAGCWTSGLCAYPAQQLQKLMGPEIAVVDGTYSATEGWLTVPLDNKPGGVLHPGAHIVEFIEEGKNIEKDNLLQCWQLEMGKNYEVFLTTAMGFVRYRLKDIVQCSGFLNKSPRLEFCYKTQILLLDTCAISGQELQKMLQVVGFSMKPYWYFARNGSANTIVLVTDDSVKVSQSLLTQMDDALQKMSETYAYSIKTGVVLPLVLLQLPKEALLADSHAQTKPRLIAKHTVMD